MAKADKEEKTVYVVNRSFISHEIIGIVFPKEHFVAISSVKLEELQKNAMFNSLLKNEDFELKDEIDDSMRTTEEQLAVSKTELIKAKQDAEALKNEALEEIKKRDQTIADKDAEIAALKAQLESKTVKQ